jgi:hypothetical protein
MRKISEDAYNAFINNRRFKSSNTEVRDEDGKIINNYGNVAKMNIWEHLVFSKFHLSNMLYTFLEIFKLIFEGLKGLCYLIANLILLLFFPVTLTYASYMRIKYCREQLNNKIHRQGRS